MTTQRRGGASRSTSPTALNHPAGMNEEGAQMPCSQLVWTAGAAVDGTGPVTFTVDGSPATDVLGVDTSAPLERASADSVALDDAPLHAHRGREGSDLVRGHRPGRHVRGQRRLGAQAGREDRTPRLHHRAECCTLSPSRSPSRDPPATTPSSSTTPTSPTAKVPARARTRRTSPSSNPTAQCSGSNEIFCQIFCDYLGGQGLDLADGVQHDRVGGALGAQRRGLAIRETSSLQ